MLSWVTLHVINEFFYTILYFNICIVQILVHYYFFYFFCLFFLMYNNDDIIKNLDSIVNGYENAKDLGG